MFKDIKDALQYIESLRVKRSQEQFFNTIKQYGFKTKLKNMIHVAGTNGKGSTVYFIREILKKHGYQVGTFTSPYMICHNDRICINGKMIDDQILLQYINELYDLINIEGLSMFEVDILIMLKYFDEYPCDFHIIETGIGGLNDKTNIMESSVSAITNIGLDHQVMLGHTLESIAIHKAGIIKNNQVFFTTERNQICLDIFKNKCLENNTKYHQVSNIISTKLPSYQNHNLSLALAICENFIACDQNKINEVSNEFSLPGRFEFIKGIYFEGAHNIDGIKTLVETIKQQKFKDVVIVLSILVDKDHQVMLKLLENYDVKIVSFEDDRAIDGRDYREVLNELIVKDKQIIVTGSMHFVSVVRKYVQQLEI